MNRHIWLFLLVVLIFMVPTFPTAAPGDSIGEAISVGYGLTNGSISNQYSSRYYNFSNSDYALNITLINYDGSEVDFEIYDHTGNFIGGSYNAENFTEFILLEDSTGDIVINVFNYIVPGDFGLIFQSVDATGHFEETSVEAAFGNNTGAIHTYLDKYYLHFFAMEDYQYNLTLQSSIELSVTISSENIFDLSVTNQTNQFEFSFEGQNETISVFLRSFRNEGNFHLNILETQLEIETFSNSSTVILEDPHGQPDSNFGNNYLLVIILIILIIGFVLSGDKKLD